MLATQSVGAVRSHAERGNEDEEARRCEEVNMVTFNPLFAAGHGAEELHGFKSLTEWNSVQTGLGVYYLLVVLLNVGFAAYHYYSRRDMRQTIIWGAVSGVFLIHALIYLIRQGPVLPQGFRDAVTGVMGWYGGQMGPILYSTLSVIGFIVFLRFRRFLTAPLVAWAILDIGLLAAGWSITDPNFRLIVTKEDNVPIVMLVVTVGFFTWLAFRKASINDERLAKGMAPMEKLEDEKVLVWPDLVYTELICMIVMTFVLVVWSVLLKAPLEQPASSAKAPNPSKAPWYFLGLQEMLVYYDPWMAGVVLPTMIIVGLIAIPYIDFNQKGNGFFTFVQRKFAVSTFLLGFVVMWCTLIVLGTFLRGPNWNFFSPFEYWDHNKVLPLNNVNLSDYFWVYGFGKVFAEGQGLGGILLRELPGIVLVLAYMALLPPLLATTVFRRFYIKMGFMRFFLLVTLIQFMAALPIKMILRWAINLKYIVYIPEIFFNI